MVNNVPILMRPALSSGSYVISLQNISILKVQSTRRTASLLSL